MGIDFETILENELFLKIQAVLPGLVNTNDVNYIYENHEIVSLLNIAQSTLENTLTEGIISFDNDFIIPVTGIIEIWRWRSGNREREEIPIGLIRTPLNLNSFLEVEFLTKGFEQKQIDILIFLITLFSEKNVFYNEEQTEINRERVKQEIEEEDPVIINFRKGETIIKKGFIITAEDMIKIKMLEGLSTTLNLYKILGSGLFLFVFYVFAIMLLNPSIINKKISRQFTYLLLSMCIFYLFFAVLILRIPNFTDTLPISVFLPTALFSMLIALLINVRVGIISSLLLSFSLFLLTGLSNFSFILAFCSSISSVLIVNGAEKRIDLMRAGAGISVVNIIVLLIMGFQQNYEMSWFISATGLGILNGFLCSILNLGLLPFFEHMLDALTPFRLIELSDINTPLFKRMITLAPGTYGHSVSVANLAESACREIGAKPLLARVGAYYHDIGKIDQAEYFIENQTSGNKHDEITPSLSAAVIKSHVKVGVEKGKELGLPKKIIDIISQHHGSGVINYFYVEAVKNNNSDQIKPEDYSYKGSPPSFKEAAVVMLADSVEAASRTLKKPTAAKLEKFIWNIIMEKITSGQMSNCDLTFSEMKIIAKIFLQILAGHFHTRIEYPDIEKTRKDIGKTVK